jgi:hypothetical protein
MAMIARIRRPIGGGHFLFGLHRHPLLTLVIILVAVGVVIYLNRRR